MFMNQDIGHEPGFLSYFHFSPKTLKTRERVIQESTTYTRKFPTPHHFVQGDAQYQKKSPLVTNNIAHQENVPGFMLLRGWPGGHDEGMVKWQPRSPTSPHYLHAKWPNLGG
mmetsp:Transcript_11964/g.21726  ORF Transcript_11964/g.21726 Transcript_11964/m.21726 type:complete len:112 (+) Transcript_11964:643-978(+)